MFVLKSTHDAKIKLLQDQLDLVATREAYQQSAEQALRNNLYAQIADLRSLVFVKVDKEAPRDAREADAVLSASEKSPDMSEEEMTRLIEGQREADLLISGNYDSDLLN